MQVNGISFGKTNNYSIRDLRPENEKNKERNKVLRTSMDYLNIINAQVFQMSVENDEIKRSEIRKDANLLINKIIYNLQNIRNENTKTN